VAFESFLRKDLLPTGLETDPYQVKAIVKTAFQKQIELTNTIERTKSPLPSKNIIEVMELIYHSITDYEERTRATEDAKVVVVYEKPDIKTNLETISISLVDRNPGMFGQGKPNGNSIRNLKPILREEIEDPDNPGYKRAILGYFYDNTLRLTCWARTAKAANLRALWLEEVMEEYSWFFAYSGVNRFIYSGRPPEIVHEVDNNKYYGRPIDYFVRTEKLRNVSQKKIETIYLKMITHVDGT